MERTSKKSLSEQMKRKVSKPIPKKGELDGNTEVMISTGSTLLDLAISGGRVRGGGIPGGILVEIFGPSGSGKTVLLCEIAGAIQRQNGDIMFHDPEARLNKQFAQMFDLDTDAIEYTTPNTIPEVFNGVRKWEPSQTDNINGIVADSLAALSTEMEMDNDDGDKMGMRRAKEFSEQLRKTARILVQKNLLMVCSNQVRQNMDAGPYGQKYTAPGGTAIGFYSSLRLRTFNPKKIKKKLQIKGKEDSRVKSIEVQIEIVKSSIWEPHRFAPITIDFSIGVDDIRENLKFIKRYSGNAFYSIGGNKLKSSLEESCNIVYNDKAENELREEVIDLWESIEKKFESQPRPRRR